MVSAVSQTRIYIIARLFLGIAVFIYSSSSLAVACKDTSGFIPSRGDGSLDFEKLVDIAQKNKSIEKTLADLNKKHKEYLKHHTLMYCSDSLQEGSYKEPRAIVFGPRAEFVFSFNGGFHQRGGRAIETMSFNSKTKNFEFREVEFRNGQQDWEGELEANEVDQERSSPFVRVSQANPGKCMTCHSPNPENKAMARPNWQDYFVWPCAYGSNDDMVRDDGYFTNNSQNRDIFLLSSAHDSEFKGYREYLKNKPNHPRLKHLPNRIMDEFYSYVWSGRDKRHFPFGTKKEELEGQLGANYGHRPNVQLMLNLNHLNSKKAASELLKKPHIKKYAPALAALQDECHLSSLSADPSSSKYGGLIARNILESFFPREQIRLFEKKLGPIESHWSNFLENQEEYKDARIANHMQNFGIENFGGYDEAKHKASLKGNSKNIFESFRIGGNHRKPDRLVFRYILDYLDFDVDAHSINFIQGKRYHTGNSGFSIGNLNCLGKAVYEEHYKKAPGNKCSELEKASRANFPKPSYSPESKDQGLSSQ